MRLLFDQNISYRVVNKLKSKFPDCLHVNQTGLKNPDDREIWQYAKQKDFVIVSHDKDFDDLILINGFPPKIVKLKTGNLSNEETIKIILENESALNEFISNPEIGLLEIE